MNISYAGSVALSHFSFLRTKYFLQISQHHKNITKMSFSSKKIEISTYLVDPGSGDMLREKIKPCMSRIIPLLESLTWLILPAVICFERKLSHACLRSYLTWNHIETASRLLFKVNSYEIILSALIFSLRSQFEKMA